MKLKRIEGESEHEWELRQCLEYNRQSKNIVIVAAIIQAIAVVITIINVCGMAH